MTFTEINADEPEFMDGWKGFENEEDEEQDFDSWRDDQLRAREDWFRGER